MKKYSQRQLKAIYNVAKKWTRYEQRDNRWWRLEMFVNISHLDKTYIIDNKSKEPVISFHVTEVPYKGY